MKWSWSEYDKARLEYESDWMLIDLALYNLCEKYPDHRSLFSINAKVNIIGKTYNSGIERLIKSDGSPGSAYDSLARHFKANGKAIDGLVGSLIMVSEPLTPEKLKTIISTHGELVNILKKVTREHHSPRSFASKYLHFHCPAVPIYDSVAAETLPQLLPWKDEFEIFRLPRRVDEEYAWFALHFWQLYVMAMKQRDKVSVKLLDHFMLCKAG